MKARRLIIAALSEDSMGGIATLADVARAEQLVDAHRAEVRAETLAEAIAETEQTASGFSTGSDWGSAAVGALRGLVFRLRQLAGGPDLPRDGATAGFQPDRTYTYGGWEFRCAAVTSHPDGGTPTAIGWICHGDSGWMPYAYEMAQWSGGWVDVTEAGAR